MSVEEAILALKEFCEEMGVKLEFIKTSGDTGYKSIHGVEFKTIIYEHDATHWLTKTPLTHQESESKQ